MVFFQAALLGGYAYAHATAAWLGIRRQTILHLALLAVPLAVLPLGVDASRLPGGEANPVLGVLVLLSLSVGLPFFVVSATAPLLQHWFTHTRSPGRPRPLLPLRRQQSREHARAAELPLADRAAPQAQRCRVARADTAVDPRLSPARRPDRPLRRRRRQAERRAGRGRTGRRRHGARVAAAEPRPPRRAGSRRPSAGASTGWRSPSPPRACSSASPPTSPRTSPPFPCSGCSRSRSIC